MNKALHKMLGALAIVVCVACSGDKDTTPTVTTAEPADVIGEPLMIALLKAKNFHHKARVYISDGKTDEAIASLREILSLQFPPDAPEADDVRNDARALLGKLLLGQGKVDEAMTIVTEGIVQSPRESFFVANLHTVEGEIHEARAARLDATDPAQASKIKDEKGAAIESYDKSNEISSALQKRLMRDR